MLKLKIEITPETKALVEKYGKDIEFHFEEMVLKQAAEIKAENHLIAQGLVPQNIYNYIMTKYLEGIEQDADHDA